MHCCAKYWKGAADERQEYTAVQSAKLTVIMEETWTSGLLGLGLVRIRVRCFVVTGGHKGVLCVWQAVLRKEEVEERHLGYSWKGGCTAC